MASVEDIRGVHRVPNNSDVFPCSSPGSMQITKEYAPDSLQQQISISEFEHSWGQNSIVRCDAAAKLLPHSPAIAARLLESMARPARMTGLSLSRLIRIGEIQTSYPTRLLG